MADHRTRTRRPARLAAITAFSLAALATVSPSPAGAASAGPCAGAYPKAITHVVVIMMENKDETSIMQSPAAPYLNTLATECGQATSYHGVAHPSLPNYLAMTGGSTFGVTDDKPPAYHKIGAASVFGQLGAGWRSYQESMGVPCQKYGTSLYAPKHNPAAYYTSLSNCSTRDVPLPTDPVFGAALRFVTPNLMDDMHDGTIQQGDTWLSAFVPKVLSSSQYQAGSLALFIVWDENDGPDHAAGNQVPCIVVAPSVPPGTKAAKWFDHYSLLATWEDLLGRPRLANAVGAASMAGSFSL